MLKTRYRNVSTNKILFSFLIKFERKVRINMENKLNDNFVGIVVRKLAFVSQHKIYNHYNEKLTHTLLIS